MPKDTGGVTVKSLHDGLTKKMPDAPSDTTPKSPSVNDGATRKDVAGSHSITEGRKA